MSALSYCWQINRTTQTHWTYTHSCTLQVCVSLHPLNKEAWTCSLFLRKNNLLSVMQWHRLPDWFKVLLFLVFSGPSFLFLSHFRKAWGTPGSAPWQMEQLIVRTTEGRRIKEWKDICCCQTGHQPCHLDKPSFFLDIRLLKEIQSHAATRIKTADWEAHLMLVHRKCYITHTHTHTPHPNSPFPWFNPEHPH